MNDDRALLGPMSKQILEDYKKDHSLRSSCQPQSDCYVSELAEAVAWIGILLNISDNPPGEHAQIIACAEEFFYKHNTKGEARDARKEENHG